MDLHPSGALALKRDEYVTMVKETLKFILIPAFAGPISDMKKTQDEE